MLLIILPLGAFYIYTFRSAQDGGVYAEIAVDGRIETTMALAGDKVYSPAGKPAVQIAVRSGRVGFVSSDCPDKICVHSGFLGISGQSAVCLPNRVVVRVKSGEGETLDSTSY
ncbi:MAG: NusG domain II-containing protein [Synergistaceae bacterium]|nr:NusG domain II-containing protein [Synergistaceae bacterium]